MSNSLALSGGKFSLLLWYKLCKSQAYCSGGVLLKSHLLAAVAGTYAGRRWAAEKGLQGV